MKILDSIEKETKLSCFHTVKYSLDDTHNPIIQYDENDRNIGHSKQKYAEDDKSNISKISVKDQANKELGNPLFKYFLDGSRKTYKIDDIAIGERIFPIVAGQIAVGACFRENGSTFLPQVKNLLKVLSLPNNINVDDLPEKEFFNDLLDIINQTKILQKVNIKFDKIFNYSTSLNKKDKNNYKNDKEWRHLQRNV